jgi:hypothetical protein
MTANQVYKAIGSSTPFSEWIGEQKTKYGKKFIENEEFLNMAGTSNFVGDDAPRTKEQIVMENIDDNIQYPAGAGLTGSVTLGQTTATASAGVSNFPTKKVVMAVGGIIVAYWVYSKYFSKK